MLSVKSGRGMEEDAPLEPGTAASWELLTTVIKLPVGLKTRVKFLFGESAISPGCGLELANETVKAESTSFDASTMFKTGVGPKAEGCKGFEMKTRNLRWLEPCRVRFGLL